MLPSRTIDEIEKNVERDKFFSADEARAFGLVDEVFDKRPVPADGEGSVVKAA